MKRILFEERLAKQPSHIPDIEGVVLSGGSKLSIICKYTPSKISSATMQRQRLTDISAKCLSRGVTRIFSAQGQCQQYK